MSRPLESIRRRIVACTRCPELRRYCARVARVRKREFAGFTYWGRPVPGLGAADAELLIVGLAPAAHGGNRTGRMFTGDGSAAWLAPALFRAGFATQPLSVQAGDGFELRNAFMTAALRCAPPKNKPTVRELRNCAEHMRAELDALERVRVVIALGKIAFDTILARLRERGYQVPRPKPRFAHGAEYRLEADGAPALKVIASFHPSRQNTNTGKLTRAMLDGVFRRARAALRSSA